MLAPTLGWDVRDGSFEHLQERLLDSFSGDIAGDRNVLAGFADLVDLVDVKDPSLGGFDIEVGCMEEFQEEVLDIFADVTGFGQCGRIADSKRNVEHLGQRSGDERFAATCGPNEQDVGLFDLDVGVVPSGTQSLVVVMDRHGQGSFGLQLADNVLIEVLDDRAWGWDISKEFFRRPTATLLLFEHRGA